jgi:hypothetical protein
VACRSAVGGSGRLRLECSGDQPAPGGVWEEARVGNAGAEVELGGLPDRLRKTWNQLPARARTQGRRRAGGAGANGNISLDIGSRSDSGRREALADQTVVGVDDGCSRDAQARGKLSCRWQRFNTLYTTLEDRRAQLAIDLARQIAPILETDVEVQRLDRSAADWTDGVSKNWTLERSDTALYRLATDGRLGSRCAGCRVAGGPCRYGRKGGGTPPPRKGE